MKFVEDVDRATSTTQIVYVGKFQDKFKAARGTAHWPLTVYKPTVRTVATLTTVRTVLVYRNMRK